jgi:small subunit ribosomal protein S27Ae
MSEQSQKTAQKKRQKGAWTRYEYDYGAGKITLKNRKCHRCGKIMAKHENPLRWSCGSCGYTEYIRKQKTKT